MEEAEGTERCSVRTPAWRIDSFEGGHEPGNVDSF